MNRYVFIKCTVQSHVIALLTVHKQLHSGTNCLSFHYNHSSLQLVQNHRKPLSLSGPAFTFVHVLTSSDLFIWFVWSLEESPDAQHRCREDSFNIALWCRCCQQVVSYGCKFIKDCQNLNGDTYVKFAAACHSQTYWFSCDHVWDCRLR